MTEPSLWPFQLFWTVYQQQFMKLTACICLSPSSRLTCLLCFNDWLPASVFYKLLLCIPSAMLSREGMTTITYLLGKVGTSHWAGCTAQPGGVSDGFGCVTGSVVHCVPKTTCDYIFFNNFNNKCLITIIFGIVSSKSMSHRKMVSFSTSPI